MAPQTHQPIAKQFGIAFVTILLFDFVWLSLNSKSYARATYAVQKSKMVVDMKFAVITYAIMAIGLYMILSDIANFTDTKTKLIRAFVWGLVIYGVYNGTNAAVFSNYDIGVAIKDTLWGGILYSSSVLIAIVLAGHFDK